MAGELSAGTVVTDANRLPRVGRKGPPPPRRASLARGVRGREEAELGAGFACCRGGCICVARRASAQVVGPYCQGDRRLASGGRRVEQRRNRRAACAESTYRGRPSTIDLRQARREQPDGSRPRGRLPLRQLTATECPGAATRHDGGAIDEEPSQAGPPSGNCGVGGARGPFRPESWASGERRLRNRSW